MPTQRLMNAYVLCGGQSRRMGQDKANPVAAILSAALMCDYLADRLSIPAYADAALLIEAAVDQGFAENALRPMEFGGDMGTRPVTLAVLDKI